MKSNEKSLVWLGAILCAAAVSAAPAPGVRTVLEMKPGPGNPRNSEGAFLRLKDGRIMYAYTRYAHSGKSSLDNAPADIAAIYSSDDGETWSAEPEIIVKNHGGMNVMSVSLLRLQNGEIAFFYLVKNSHTDCRPVMRRSSDEGRTWSEPTCCITDKIRYYTLNNDRVIQLRDGRLLFAVGEQPLLADGKFDPTGSAVTYFSDDNGATWHRGRSDLKIVAPSGHVYSAQEPGVVELKDGSILLWIRTDAGSQFMSRSSDRGETFTPPQPSWLYSPLSPASIKRLPSGELIAIWNDHEAVPEMRKKQRDWQRNYDACRSPFAAAISRDEGQTWTNGRLIDDDPNGWFCYTAIEPLDDGSILLGHCAYGILAHSRISKIAPGWLPTAGGQGASGKIKVACIGDSITYGTAMTNRVAECYPTQLQRILGDRYEVRNFGDAGAGIYLHTKRKDRPRAWRLRDEYAPAIAFQPDIVVCNLGINDASTHMDEYVYGEDGKPKLARGLFRKQYVDMLESFVRDGRRPRFIIWTKLGPTGKKHWLKGKPFAFVMESDLEQVARDVGAETLDMFTPLVPFAETPDFCPDGVHPEGGAQKVIAEITAAKILGRAARR